MNKHLYISKGEENFPGENIKFLMQDGYYFTMSNIYPLPSTVGCSPGVAVKEIYSPSGELLYSGYFSVSYIYYKRNSGITPQDLETMTKLYKAYHALGCNGIVAAVFEKILKLPISEGV